jgi:hypothetical protein
MELAKKIGRLLLTAALVAGLGAGAWFGFHSEPFQRVLGKREDTKVVLDQERPVFASAVVRERRTAILSNEPSTVVLESTITVDRASNRARVEHARALTGLDAAQTSVGDATQPETLGRDVWTLEARFAAGVDDTTWVRHGRSSISVRGTVLDTYLVPVRNDVVGLELASLEYVVPGEPVADGSPGADPGAAGTVPSIEAAPPPEVTDLRRWRVDLATFESVSPVALAKTPFGDLDPATTADVTMGFDDAGVLRYLQVTVDPMRVPVSEFGTQVFSFEWTVVELRDVAEEIEVPTDVVDATA